MFAPIQCVSMELKESAPVWIISCEKQFKSLIYSVPCYLHHPYSKLVTELISGTRPIIIHLLNIPTMRFPWPFHVLAGLGFFTISGPNIHPRRGSYTASARCQRNKCAYNRQISSEMHSRHWLVAVNQSHVELCFCEIIRIRISLFKS